jgi:hypothetical protein
MSRTYDLLAFQHSLQPGDRQTQQVLFAPGVSGLGCTGIQKLAQRVLLELLTELGTIKYLPDRGTDLVSAFRRGEVRTELDVFMTFGFAASKATVNIQADELATDPEDEQLVEISLERVAILPETAQLYAKITSAAGESRTIQIPISTLQ